MTKRKRTKHSPAFKAKVALAALREQESVAEIARRHKVHANVVYKWKRQLMDNVSRAFESEENGGDATERESVEGGCGHSGFGILFVSCFLGSEDRGGQRENQEGDRELLHGMPSVSTNLNTATMPVASSQRINLPRNDENRVSTQFSPLTSHRYDETSGSITV